MKPSEHHVGIKISTIVNSGTCKGQSQSCTCRMVPLVAMLHLGICKYQWLCPWQLGIAHPLHALVRMHMHFFVCSPPHC